MNSTTHEPEPWSFRELTAGYWGGPALQAALAPARVEAVFGIDPRLLAAPG